MTRITVVCLMCARGWHDACDGLMWAEGRERTKPCPCDHTPEYPVTERAP